MGNGGTKPTQAAFVLSYNGGTKSYELDQTLQPDDQMWIDVGDLIRQHIPDKNGNPLPENLAMGSYEVRELTHKGIGSLFEGKVVYDKTYGHVTYGCASCCAEKLIRLFYDPLGIPDLGTAGQGVQATDTCTGHLLDISSDFDFSWTTANHAIATVDTYGTHTGQSEGTTSTLTCAQEQVQYRWNSCPVVNYCPGGNDNVKPTISGPNTLWWFNGLGAGVSGYTTQITLTANPGGVGTTFTWSITAGSDKVSLSGSTSASVQVTSIGQSKQANDVSITVTVGGFTSAPFNLTVRAPYTLGSDPGFPTPVYSTDPTYVWNIEIYYDVLDNFLTPMPSTVSVNENWTTGIVPDYSGENWRRGNPGCSPTGSRAGFADFIQGEVPSQHPTPVYNTAQNGTAVYHWGQEWRVGTCNNGSGPRVQTDTLQKYTDHAAHTGIVSPAP